MWILEIHTEVLIFVWPELILNAIFQPPSNVIYLFGLNNYISSVAIFKFCVALYINFLLTFHFAVSNLSLSLFTKLSNVTYFFQPWYTYL